MDGTTALHSDARHSQPLISSRDTHPVCHLHRELEALPVCLVLVVKWLGGIKLPHRSHRPHCKQLPPTATSCQYLQGKQEGIGGVCLGILVFGALKMS